MSAFREVEKKIGKRTRVSTLLQELRRKNRDQGNDTGRNRRGEKRRDEERCIERRGLM